MTLTFVPLLQVQRDLYGLPRGMERFREYIRTMTDAATGDLVFIGRADTTAGCTNLGITASSFTRLVKGNMVGEDQGASRR